MEIAIGIAIAIGFYMLSQSGDEPQEQKPDHDFLHWGHVNEITLGNGKKLHRIDHLNDSWYIKEDGEDGFGKKMEYDDVAAIIEKDGMKAKGCYDEKKGRGDCPCGCNGAGLMYRPTTNYERQCYFSE